MPQGVTTPSAIEGVARPVGLGAPSAVPRVSDADAVLAHIDEAYNLARWLVRSAVVAEGVVEDAVLCALAEPRMVQPRDVRTQVLRTVRAAAYARLAAAPVAIDEADALAGPAASFPGAAETVSETGLTAEALFARAEAAQRLDGVLAELPLELRECLVLSALHSASYDEISAIAQIPVGAVQARLWRGRCMLVRLAARLADADIEKEVEPTRE